MSAGARLSPATASKKVLKFSQGANYETTHSLPSPLWFSRRRRFHPSWNRQAPLRGRARARYGGHHPPLQRRGSCAREKQTALHDPDRVAERGTDPRFHPRGQGLVGHLGYSEFCLYQTGQPRRADELELGNGLGKRLLVSFERSL